MGPHPPDHSRKRETGCASWPSTSQGQVLQRLPRHGRTADASPPTTGCAGSGGLRLAAQPVAVAARRHAPEGPSPSNSPKGSPYAPYRLATKLSTAGATRGAMRPGRSLLQCRARCHKLPQSPCNIYTLVWRQRACAPSPSVPRADLKLQLTEVPDPTLVPSNYWFGCGPQP